MKVFKYLIFIFASLISINSFAYYFAGPHGGAKLYGGETAPQACTAYANAIGKVAGWTDTGSCIDKFGSNYGGYEQAENKCRYDSDFTWDSSNPAPNTPPSSVCYNKCNYNVTWASSSYDNGNKLSWYGVGKGTGSSCEANTDFGDGQGQTEGGNGSNGQNGNCTTTNGTTTCTGGTGGTGGSGSGGSGGAGGTGGNASITVDMQSVVNAVNELKNSIATKLEGLSNTITNMSIKITDAIGITNSKLEDIKNNQKSQTTEIKNAINEGADKVSVSVKENTNAVNANAQTIKTAVNENTDAVNNSTAENKLGFEALKLAIENISASVNVVVQNQQANNQQSSETIDKSISDNSEKVVSAVNASADKITNAVNENRDKISDSLSKTTDAINENGKKLDAIKKSIDDGNDFNKDGANNTFPEHEDTKLPEIVLAKKSFTETIFGTSSQCPANKTLSMAFMHKSFIKTFDFTEWCYYLGLLGQMILIGAYLHGANIVTRS